MIDKRKIRKAFAQFREDKKRDAEARKERAAAMGFSDPDIMDVFEQNSSVCSSSTDWGTVMEMRERGELD